MAYKSKWHIGLNRKSTAEGSKTGYVVQPGTYHCRKQDPKLPRFTSGDQAIQDLTYLSYAFQRNFSGGQGQTLFQDDTRYGSSQGVDVISKRGLDDKPLESGFKLSKKVDIANAALGSGDWRMCVWAGKIWLADLTSGALKTWNGSTLTAITTIPGGIKSIKIGFHWETFVAVPDVDNRWPTLTIMSGSGLTYMYDMNGVLKTMSHVLSDSYSAGYHECVFNSSIYSFYLDSQSDEPGIKMEKWSMNLQINRAHSLLPGTRVSSTCVGGDPLQLYIVTVDDTAEKSYISVTDGGQLAYNVEPPWLKTQTILEFDGIIECAKEWRNTIVYSGWKTNSSGGKTGFIYSYPWNLIYETPADASDRSIFAIHTDDIVCCSDNANKGLFMFDVNGFSTGPAYGGGLVRITDIIRYKGLIHFVANNTIYKVSTNNYITSGYLETSFHDCQQPLINKVWNKLVVGLKKPLATGQTVVAKVRRKETDSWTTLFTWTSGDTNIIKEATISYDWASPKLQVRLDLTTNTTTDSPEVEQVAIGYFPGTTRLLAWKFVLPIGPKMRLMDGTLESRNTETLRTALKTLAQYDEILEYVDIGGGIHDVLVHEFSVDAKTPETEKGYLCTMTLLEMES